MLILNDYAAKSHLERHSKFEGYIIQNHKSWYMYATSPEKRGLILAP